MSGRSPARLLAPAALIVTFVALLIVLGGGGGEEEQSAERGTRSVATTPSKARSSGESTSSKRPSSSKRYTVKPGDTPSSIAEAAGIPLDRLLELNPDIDPQALSPGQKLKLGP